jgi:hypothetical protein
MGNTLELFLKVMVPILVLMLFTHLFDELNENVPVNHCTVLYCTVLYCCPPAESPLSVGPAFLFIFSPPLPLILCFYQRIFHLRASMSAACLFVDIPVYHLIYHICSCVEMNKRFIYIYFFKYFYSSCKNKAEEIIFYYI